MAAQREANPVDRRRILRDGVERCVERTRAFAHGLEQELLLRADQRVERPLLHAERLRERVHRRSVEAALREEPCRLAGEIVSSSWPYTRC